MRRLFTFFCLVLLVQMSTLTQAEQDAEALGGFVDGFFTRFAELSQQLRQGENASANMALVHHARAHFVRSTEVTIRETGHVPEVEIVGKLFLHGPRSWELENIHIAGDVAKGTINFTSVRESEPGKMPFEFKFIRVSGAWRILGYKDLRPPPEATPEVILPHQETQSPAAGAEKTLTDYLAHLHANRSAVDIRKPAEMHSAARQISEDIAPLWLEDPAARRARNEGTSKILLQDLESWVIEELSIDGETASARVSITPGERSPFKSLKLLMRVRFTLVLKQGIWRLSGFELIRS